MKPNFFTRKSKLLIVVIFGVILAPSLVFAFISKSKQCLGGRVGDAVLLQRSQYAWAHPIWQPLPRELLQSGTVSLWVMADDTFLNAPPTPLIGFSGQFRVPPSAKESISNDIMHLYKTGTSINFSFRSVQGINWVMPTWGFSPPWAKHEWNHIVVTWTIGERPRLFHNGKEISYLASETAVLGQPLYFDQDFRLDVGGFRKSETYLPNAGVLFDEIVLYYHAIDQNKVQELYKQAMEARRTTDWLATFDKSDQEKFQITFRTKPGGEISGGYLLGQIYFDEERFHNAPTIKCSLTSYWYRRFIFKEHPSASPPSISPPQE